MNDSLLAPCAPALATILPSVPRSSERPHALLVYEEEDVLEHIRWMLLREQCDVSAFSSLRDAVSGMQQGLRPDVALIHAGLRLSDGTPALTSFRQLSPAVPAIAISCCHDPRCIVETLRSGAFDVLIHPFDHAELESTLKRCFDLAFSRK